MQSLRRYNNGYDVVDEGAVTPAKAENPDVMVVAEAVASAVMLTVPENAIDRLFVMMCGVTHSGKSTVRRSDPVLRRLLAVEADDLRDLVDEHVAFGEESLLPDHTERRRKGMYVSSARELVFARAFDSGVGVVSDAGNKQRDVRAARLQQARGAGYQTAIVWVSTPEEVLLERLRQEDAARVSRGLPEFWVREYEQVHLRTFEPPDDDEADLLLTVDGTSPQPPLAFS